MKTRSALSPPLNDTTNDIGNLFVDDVRTDEQYRAYGIDIVRHKNSNGTMLNEKPPLLKLCEKCSRPGHSIANCRARWLKITIRLTKHSKTNIQTKQ